MLVLQEALHARSEGCSSSAVSVAHVPGKGEVLGTAGRGGKADCPTGGRGTQEACTRGRGEGETPAGGAGAAEAAGAAGLL